MYQENLNCLNHKHRLATQTCSICEIEFCDDCLVPFRKNYLCKTHFEKFNNYIWKQKACVASLPENSLDGIKLYEYKKKQWESFSRPMLIEVSYQLKLDSIETIFTLFEGEKFNLP